MKKLFWDEKWNDFISSALTLVQNMRGRIRRQTNVNKWWKNPGLVKTRCYTGSVRCKLELLVSQWIIIVFNVIIIPLLRKVAVPSSWGSRDPGRVAIYIYLLTPRSRVLLEKLTGLQLVKKFPAFFGTRKFITAFTRSRHLSRSWGSSIQSIPPHPTSSRSIIILSSHLRLGLPSGLLPSDFPTKTLYTPFTSPHMR